MLARRWRAFVRLMVNVSYLFEALSLEPDIVVQSPSTPDRRSRFLAEYPVPTCLFGSPTRLYPVSRLLHPVLDGRPC